MGSRARHGGAGALVLALLAGCNAILGIDDPRHRILESCGDGALGAGEGCDDGDAKDGDGCDASCQVESGYTCAGTPSVCGQCGDGALRAGEGCDDGNTAAGDGCSADCAPEHGFTCAGEPSACAVTCGDGVVAAGEACDDGDKVDGDGCDGACAVEHGFTCGGEPSACATKCGDGAIGAGEKCDDANAKDGDGCSAACEPEAGFTCGGEPTACAPICGDGLVRGGEACDDGNTEGGDGCDPACGIEPGFACAGEPSFCGPLCGDGVVIGAEQCDDGNNQGGDCCSAACQIEAGCEIEPNGSRVEADARAAAIPPILFTGDGKIRGAVEPAGDVDLFVLDLAPALSVVRIETFDGAGADCPAGTDTRLALLNDVAAINGDGDGGIGLCSALEINVNAGSWYLKIDHPSGQPVSAYTLEVDVQPSAGTEGEPNDSLAMADLFNGTDGFIAGGHQGAADVDFFKITVPAAGLSVRAEILEGSGAETCESGGIASDLALLTSGNTVLAAAAGGGRGACSRIDGTGAMPLDVGAHGLAAGTYYLRVKAASGAVGQAAQFDYKLAVVIR